MTHSTLPPHSTSDVAAACQTWRNARLLTLSALALLLTGAGVRTYLNVAHAKSVQAQSAHNAQRTVLVTQARPGQGNRTIALPATLRGQSEVALYARTNGYVKSWTKDIGDTVRKGEVLAIIDTPEVDQDLAQAKANQAQIKARLALTQSSLTRWESLRGRDAVSQQEVDERRAAFQQAQADLAASSANVRRLQQLHDFGVITSPIHGVVVKRNLEVGNLIAAGSTANTKSLYDLAQTDTLRLTVAVPQVYAHDITVGKDVSVKLLERPQSPGTGRITRIAGGMDVATRALQVEVSLDNSDKRFLPGSYVEVGLPLSGSNKAILLPPNALQFRQSGPRVAVVDADSKIRIRDIKLGRDLGRAVEVVSGLAAKETVVLNPPDTIEDGERVATRQAPDPKPEGKDKGGKAGAPEKGGKA
ncbi:MAG: efflux RND transporter periplasmic adaptor subunit [Aquabacterium sp.]|uniref:efflux RND transporter periplasmic adaptor subunit n=1 Tax=Aquabacterium sp. TaxID=1872578 RepID=UPI003BCD9CCF